MKLHTALTASVSAAAILTSIAPSYAAGLDDLVAAATKEGQLTVIALPHDWCGYGAVIDAFKKKYPGITVNELNPDAGSGDEIQAIKANMGNAGPQAPDVIDVGLSFGPSSKTDKLIQPYKVSTWDSIPDSAKDADGYWYGDYYGVLSFLVNDDIVKTAPKTWADLQKPGADAGTAGLKFFADLNKAGNFVPVIGKAAPVAQGTTPIVAAWDYNALAWKDGFNGNPKAEVIVPSDAVVAGVYIQAISAYAPHLNAAKLWEEFLYSDEGQTLWLAGYCHPIRFNDLAAKKAIPADLLAKLPDPALYAKAVFPTLDEQSAAKDVITKQWDSVVGANVK